MYYSTMKYEQYIPDYKEACMTVFKSNVPKYFLSDEISEFDDWLETGDLEHYYVIKDSRDEIIGCGGIYIDHQKKKGGFTWGMIHADLQGRNIGKAFSLFRIDLIKKLCDYDQHLVTTQHTAGFYSKLGFEVEKTIPDFYGPGMDKYIMKRTNS